MSAATSNHLRETERPADQDSVERLQDRIADIERRLTSLASIAAELADHLYWHEAYGNDNKENKAHLRSLKEQAQRITIGLPS